MKKLNQEFNFSAWLPTYMKMPNYSCINKLYLRVYLPSPTKPYIARKG